MNSKLEERLYLYERDHPIHSDQDLLAALEAILAEQDSFPVEQKDFDLISEATEFALHLQGYSDEQLTEMANASGKRILDRIHEKSIPAKRRTPKSRRTRLAWIILVAIVGALTITSVSASMRGINIMSATKDFIINLINHNALTVNDQDFIAQSNYKTFNSISDLSKEFNNFVLMLPNPKKGDIKCTEINSALYDNDTTISILAEIPSYEVFVTIVIIHSKDYKESIVPTESLCGRDVLLSKINDNTQCEFFDENSNHYIIQSQSLDAIKLILDSMEVIK